MFPSNFSLIYNIPLGIWFVNLTKTNFLSRLSSNLVPLDCWGYAINRYITSTKLGRQLTFCDKHKKKMIKCVCPYSVHDVVDKHDQMMWINKCHSMNYCRRGVRGENKLSLIIPVVKWCTRKGLERGQSRNTYNNNVAYLLPSLFIINETFL